MDINLFGFNLDLYQLWQSTQPWLITKGPRILGIIAGAYFLRKSSSIFIEKAIRKAIVADGESKKAEKQREDTLIQVADSTIRVIIWIVAGLMIISELGFAIAPIAAAAGVAGIAFGFGGQYLIKDVISGLFILLENQYRVGDVVCFGDTCGMVEKITLRQTVLRDLDGVVHHIPHGEIKSTSNLTKDYARVNLDIGIAYDSNLEKVIKVINQTGQELAEDPQWKDKIIKPPQFLRVEEFADSAIIIKILGETKPLEQWAVAGELRKRLKIAFDNNNIEIPFPQRVIHQAK